MRPIFGEYECRLDAKGRFLFPSALLSLLSVEDQHTFVINRGLDPCLVMFPYKIWEAELQKIYAKNQFVEKNRSFARMFQNGAQAVELDGQKRILIPKKLLDHAKMDKDILLIGSYDRIELWSSEVYEKWLQENDGKLVQWSEEVMKKEDED